MYGGGGGGGGFFGGIHAYYSYPDTCNVTFFDKTISTTVTADSSAVSNWISNLLDLHRHSLRTLLVGLDVEWRPPFGPGRNPVAVLQICVDSRCLVYQIIHSHGDIPQSLVDFLSDERFTFVGVGVQADLNRLCEDHGIGGYARTLDLGSLAARVYGRAEMRSSGLKDLARIVLGRNVEKPRWVTTSRWDNRRLSEEQVDYACIDAYVSFELGRVLQSRVNY